MVFYTDFGLSGGSIEGVHSSVVNPGEKKKLTYLSQLLSFLLCWFCKKTFA